MVDRAGGVGWFLRARRAYPNPHLPGERGAPRRFDRASGALLWHVTYTVVSPAAWATSAGGTVVSGADWSIRAFDASTGALRWRYEFQPDTVNGAIISVTISGDTVYAVAEQLDPAGLNPKAVAMAVRLTDGTELWRGVAPEPERGGLRSAVIAGSLLIAGDYRGGVQAFDRFTGLRPWRTTGDPCCAGVTSAPIVRDNLLYYVSGDETVVALDLPSGSRRWTTNVPGSLIVQPALCRDRLFANNDYLYKFDRFTGAVVGIALNSETELPTSGIAAHGELAFVVGNDRVYAFRCD